MLEDYDSDEQMQHTFDQLLSNFDNMVLSKKYERPDFSQYNTGESDQIFNISDKDEVIKWIRRYYLGRGFERLETDMFNFSKFYSSVIDRAIIANQPEIIDILYQGIYFHDRSFPDYESSLKTALSFANLETFKFVLTNFFKGFVYDSMDNISKTDFEDCLKLNPHTDTKNWINENRYYIYDIVNSRVSNFN